MIIIRLPLVGEIPHTVHRQRQHRRHPKQIQTGTCPKAEVVTMAGGYYPGETEQQKIAARQRNMRAELANRARYGSTPPPGIGQSASSGGGGGALVGGQPAPAYSGPGSVAHAQATNVAYQAAQNAPLATGSAAWWAIAISQGVDAAKAAVSPSQPTSPSQSTTYTDPRTGHTFANKAQAAALGYAPVLVAGGRDDAHALSVEAIGKASGRTAQEAYMSRHDDPLATPFSVKSTAPGVDASAKLLAAIPPMYNVTDPQVLALMKEKNLTSYQAAEVLRKGVSTPGSPGYTPSTRDDRYYENIIRKAGVRRTVESGIYHDWAQKTGLPQKPNPYEYTADLFVYMEHGVPKSDKYTFSQVDPTTLGLKDGQGMKDYAWVDTPRDYSRTVDVIAKAERTGEMGPYKDAGRSYSSRYGETGGYLSLSVQQAIGAKVALSPYKAIPDKIDYGVWGQTPEQLGRGKFVPIVTPTPTTKPTTKLTTDPVVVVPITPILDTRPGYTSPAVIGDSETQRRIAAGQTPLAALNAQLIGAYKTPTKVDDRYFANELSKMAQTYIETPSAYHHATLATGLPWGPNPYEYLGDVALEFQKGTQGLLGAVPTEQSTLGLVRGRGLQDTAWINALRDDRAGGAPLLQPDWTKAVSVLDKIRLSGDMGPYANLRSYSSTFGVLSVSAQQVIAKMAATGRGEPFTEFGPHQSIRDEAKSLGYGIGMPAAPEAAATHPVSKGMQIPSNVPTPPTPVGELPYATIGTTGISTYAHDIIEKIKVTPYGVGGAYYLSEFIGKQLSVEQRGMVVDFVEKIPFTDVLRSGVEAFVTKSDYEKVATIREKEVATLLPSYEANLADYNTQKSQYEQSPTQEGYESLLSKHSALTSERDVIESKISDVKTAETKYTKKAGELTGDVEQSKLVTYGLGSWVGGVGKGYRETIEDPIRKVAAPYGFVGDVGIGLATVPSMLLTSGQAALIGGETIVRKPESAAAIATAGVFMMGKGMYDLGTTHPGELIGSIAGMFLLGHATVSAVPRVVGLIKTRGLKYAPIETIGYDAPPGYPIKPRGGTASQLIQSFKEGTLIPAPKKMSITGKAPDYVPGAGGRPPARLPNAELGDITLWTAHASDSLIRPTGVSPATKILSPKVKVGEAFVMEAPGSSELSGISAAPVAEGYFAKVGGQVPESIGLYNPIKTPTIFRTVVSDLETIPKGMTNAQIDAYMAARLTDVPAGQGFVPMIKAEFEANIPTQSVFRVVGTEYYTKLGGFGKSHFLGTRVPIVELETIGYVPKGTPSNLATTAPSSSYKAPPYINYLSLYGAPTVASVGVDVDESIVPIQPSRVPSGVSTVAPSVLSSIFAYPRSTVSGYSERASITHPVSSTTPPQSRASTSTGSLYDMESAFSSILLPSSSLLSTSKYTPASYKAHPSSVASSPSSLIGLSSSLVGSPSSLVGSSSGSPSVGSPSGSSGSSAGSPPSSYGSPPPSYGSASYGSGVPMSHKPITPATPVPILRIEKKQKYKMQTKKYFPFVEWFRVGEGVEWESFMGVVPTRSARIIKSHPKIIPPDRVPDKIYDMREYAPVPRNLKNPVQFGFLERSLAFHAGQGLSKPQQLQKTAMQRRTAPPARVKNKPVVVKKSKPIKFGSRKKSMRF